MPSPAHPGKDDRRAQAKAAADALRAKQVKDAARQRTIAVSALVVLLVVVGVAVAVILNTGKSSSTATADQVTPAAASAHGGLVFDTAGLLTPPADQVGAGADGATGTADDVVWPHGLAASGGPVVVSVYFDFMCPWCGVFEQTQGPKLDVLRAGGVVVIDSHPVAILDRYSSGTQYSSRAAAAAMAVADGDPTHYFVFVEALMAKDVQPAENSTGLTDASIVAIAKGVGVPQAVLDQISSGAYLDYAAKATDLASQDLGSLHTPTILINGQELTIDWTQNGALEAAIQAAAQA
jgi:protein-disulfide isomerase